MGTFIHTAGIAVINELFFKKRFDRAHDRLMHNSISNDRFVNLSLFWIVYRKSLVGMMRISTIRQETVQRGEIGTKILLIVCDVIASLLATRELLPGTA